MGNSYSAIARVYDKLNASIEYEKWADFIEKQFDRYLPSRPALVLDLACGTGRMTRVLSKRGYDMIGVDNSVEMLTEAMMKNYDANGERVSENNILYLNQDMRSFELYGTVGAVVSCLDSMNYLTDDGSLEACFSLVHNYLDPDGIFIFDMNSPYKFENIYGQCAYILEDTVYDGEQTEGSENTDADSGRLVYCGWQNEYDRESRLCKFYLSLFEETEDGRYIRSDEEQCERCYTEDEVRDTLERCGFEFLGVYSGYDFEEASDTSERLYFAARAKKPEI